MISVNAKDFRAKLKYYLDKLEEGETITILRNSYVIGKLVPANEPRKPKPVKYNLPDVTFRKFGMYEDPEPLIQLHRQTLETDSAFSEYPDSVMDLESIGNIYENMGGEFWVGEMDGEIVAMGAFKLCLEPEVEEGAAEIKRMRVRPDMQGKGIGTELLKLLEDRIRQSDYQTIVLSTIWGKQAENFYKAKGYTETKRQKEKDFEVIFYRKSL